MPVHDIGELLADCMTTRLLGPLPKGVLRQEESPDLLSFHLRGGLYDIHSQVTLGSVLHKLLTVANHHIHGPFGIPSEVLHPLRRRQLP